MRPNNPVIVAGVGMVQFAKPGASRSYVEMGGEATRLALAEAGLDYAEVQQAYAGYVYGDSTCGQRVLYEVGMTGLPIVNVNNNCATGSTALYLARQAVASGMVDCALAVGFEEMQPGPIVEHWKDRVSTFARFNAVTDELVDDQIPLVLRYFVGVGREHMQRYGTRLETFAKIRAKASRHAARNPMALLREELTPEDVLRAQVIAPGVMTRLMACPPTCGAAAAVVVSPEFARRHGIAPEVQILAQALVTDRPPTFENRSMISLLGAGTNREAARHVYEEAGIGPEEIDVCELHDCFAQAELTTYEALGFCPEGGAEKFVEDGDNTYGGKVVVNPSGGLLSKGHPLGATGLAQCFELTHQLRGTAGTRQVPDVRFALQHNLGLGSAAVVTLYGRA